MFVNICPAIHKQSIEGRLNHDKYVRHTFGPSWSCTTYMIMRFDQKSPDILANTHKQEAAPMSGAASCVCY